MKDNLRSSTSLHSFLYCGILIQELDLKVEEDIIQSLWIFVQDVLRARSRRHAFKMEAGGEQEFTNVFEEVEFETGKGLRKGKGMGYEDEEENLGTVGKFLKSKLYIEELSLGSIKVNVSYIKSSGKDEGGGGAGGQPAVRRAGARGALGGRALVLRKALQR